MTACVSARNSKNATKSLLARMGSCQSLEKMEKMKKRFCDQVAPCEEAEKQLAGCLIIRKWINKMLAWKLTTK